MSNYNDFPEWLRQLRYGEASEELTDKLRELVDACVRTNKAGSLTFRVTLKPSLAGSLEVVDDIAVKVPELSKGSTIMFPTPEGRLQRNDPRQPELTGIRMVDDPPAPRDVYKDAR